MSRTELPRAGLVTAAVAGRISNREGAAIRPGRGPRQHGARRPAPPADPARAGRPLLHAPARRHPRTARWPRRHPRRRHHHRPRRRPRRRLYPHAAPRTACRPPRRAPPSARRRVPAPAPRAGRTRHGPPAGAATPTSVAPRLRSATRASRRISSTPGMTFSRCSTHDILIDQRQGVRPGLTNPRPTCESGPNAASCLWVRAEVPPKSPIQSHLFWHLAVASSLPSASATSGAHEEEST